MDDDKQMVQGFKASAVSAGLKKGNALDMALIYSEREAVAAGVFTTNKVKAAPVLLTPMAVLSVTIGILMTKRVEAE